MLRNHIGFVGITPRFGCCKRCAMKPTDLLGIITISYEKRRRSKNSVSFHFIIAADGIIRHLGNLKCFTNGSLHPFEFFPF